MLDHASRALIANPFQPVDIDGVARRLKLIARGRDDGAKELPAADGDIWAQAELDVIADIGSERDRCVQELAGQLRAIQGALAQIDTHMNIAEVRQHTATAEADFRAIAHSVATEVAASRGRARDARLEFEKFRGSHRLDRPPRDVTARNRIWLWLAPVTLLEVVLNGLFLAPGSDQGIVGGMALALGLSIVNVWMIGAVGGYIAFRWIRRREWLLKLTSFLGCIAVVGSLLGLNLFVAHLRDMYAASQDTTPDPSAIIANLMKQPLHFASIESILLLLLGIGCGCLGMWKFFTYDDPYPGYGAVHRRLRNAETHHAEARQDLLEDATEVRDGSYACLRTAAL
jgi:hypothetical protein